MASYDDTATVSGSVVSIENGADEVGAKSCVVTVRPTLSGVSSVTENQIPSRNMASMSDADFTLNSVHYHTENGILYIDGTSTGETSSNDNAFKALDFWLPSGTYFFNRGNLLDLNVATYLRKYDDKSQIKANTGSFTLTENTHLYISFYVYNKVFSNVKATIYINIGSTAITYEDTAPITQYTANLGRTIYGGTADIVNGVGQSSYKIITVGNSGWNYYASGGYIYKDFNDKVTPIIGDTDHVLVTDNPDMPYGGVNYASQFQDLHVYQAQNKAIYIKDTSCTSVNDFYTKYSDMQIGYELATPTDFTFTGQEVPTRLGYNAFWSDSGDTELTYYKSGYGFTSVTVNKTSKNLFDISKVATTGTTAGISWSVSGNEITISGTATSSGWKKFVEFKLPHKGTYHFHMNATGNVGYFLRGWTQLVGKDVTEVCNDPSQVYRIAIAATTTGQTYEGIISEIQIEVGDAYTSYEPYEAVSKTAYLHKVIYGGKADVIRGTCEPKNLFDVGTQRSDYNRGQVTNVSDGVVSFEIYSSGNTFAYRNYNIKTFGMITFSAVASKKSSRFIIRIRNKANTAWLSNNDTSIDGWNYNAVFGGWYKESSSTTEPTQTATIPNTDASFWQLGLGYANTYTTVGETETISDIMVEEGSTASSYVPHFEPFTFPPISISTDEGENTLFANEGDSAITYRKAVD